MTLAAGAHLGPYEIVAPIGSGGMGEVYRARDERLKRDVAVKVLPATYSQDADRLRRFEQEAQAAGGLNHPNITAVYDLGSHDGAPYIVTELLEGETLRARLSGGVIAVRKATDYAVQIAKGLAAAHEKGIIHRDLKPENLFLTNDGRVKILDFGLAKLTQIEASGPQTNLPTATGTEPGVVMGTLGYMSPEQVKGKAADQRSDLFAFGAILYEMLSGQRAFHRDSAAETMSAILREEPPDLSATNRTVQPGLERIVRHCLEKNPEERFYSARDVAFDLEALSGLSAPQTASTAGVARRRAALPLAAAVLAIVAAGITGYWLRARQAPPPSPLFHQLTFRRGSLWTARFGSDGKTVLYSAAWDAGRTEIFVGRADSPEARPFGLVDADVLAVSPSGEVAVALHAARAGPFVRSGTLARVAATGGGAPREVLEGVEFADFPPDGKDIAIIRKLAGKYRLEYPAGKILYETAGWIGNPRFSPRGDWIAFVDHPTPNDDGGLVAVIDLAGKKTPLTPLYASANGLAWSPDGSEIWFAAAEVGGNRYLQAATLSGKRRVLFRGTGALTLADVSRDGRVLVSHDLNRVGAIAQPPGETRERDLSWFDWSLLADLSRDGRTILFTESGEGGGAGYSVYLRPTDGTAAVRLGEGNALAISPDGKQVFASLHPQGDRQLVSYPTGPGESKAYPLSGLGVGAAAWFPDGRRFLMVAREPGHRSRVFLVDGEGRQPRPVTPEGTSFAPRIIDDRRFTVRLDDGRRVVYQVDGGEPVPLPGIGPTDSIIGVAARQGWVYVLRGGGTLPAHIVLVEMATGHEEPWKDIVPADPTGVVGLFGIRVSPDGGSYAYSYGRTLSSLYVVDGVR